MKRTQIQLPESQVDRLDDVANQQGTSRAEIIRRALEEWLTNHGFVPSEKVKEQARSVVGKYRDESSDVSEHHDDHVSDAVSS